MLIIGEKQWCKNDQRSRTQFLGKCGVLFIYYDEKRYTIDNEDINFANKDDYDLIGNPDNPDGTSTDHEHFLIHDDLLGRILETDQNSNIVLNIISKDVSLLSINDSSTD